MNLRLFKKAIGIQKEIDTLSCRVRGVKRLIGMIKDDEVGNLITDSDIPNLRGGIRWRNKRIKILTQEIRDL